MGLARGSGSNEKVEMTRFARPDEGCTVLIYSFLPWLCLVAHVERGKPPLRGTTRSVLVHFAARAMLSSRAPERFRARIIQEARAYEMNMHMDV